MSFGDEEQGRSWDDARKYGFVSAGGGAWYSKTLRSLPVGARVFAYIPQAGYVGVGTSTGEARPFDDVLVTVDGQQRKLAGLPLHAPTTTRQPMMRTRPNTWVPVEWTSTRPKEQAVHQKGLFANQNSACKLRNRFTLTALYTEFGLDNADQEVQRPESHSAVPSASSSGRIERAWSGEILP